MSPSPANLNISSSSSGGSNGSLFQPRSEPDSPHMIITQGSYQPSIEVTKPFEMADFYKYSTKFRQRQAGQLSSSGSSSSLGSHDAAVLSPQLPPRAAPTNALLAKASPTPQEQQKGVYQPLTPLTCQPLLKGATPATGDPKEGLGGAWEAKDWEEPVGGWEASPIHQALPAAVTNKRATTLV